MLEQAARNAVLSSSNPDESSAAKRATKLMHIPDDRAVPMPPSHQRQVHRMIEDLPVVLIVRDFRGQAVAPHDSHVFFDAAIGTNQCLEIVRDNEPRADAFGYHEIVLSKEQSRGETIDTSDAQIHRPSQSFQE